MGVVKRQFKKFADWVDSHGKGAGDWMLVGVVCGGLASGVLSMVLGFACASVALVSIGFALVMLHGGFAMAVS